MSLRELSHFIIATIAGVEKQNITASHESTENDIIKTK